MRTLRTSVPLLLAALALGGGAPSASASTACASGDAMAPEASTAKLASAAACLVNQERTKRGLQPLRVNRRLTRAAAAHAGDMVRRGYFSHDNEGGGDFASRIRNAGYVAPNAFPSL